MAQHIQSFLSLVEQKTQLLQGTALFGIPLLSYLTVFAIILAGYLLRKFIIDSVVAILKKITRKTQTTIDDMMVDLIHQPLRILVVLWSVFLANRCVPYPERLLFIYQGIDALTRVGFIIIVALLFSRFLNALLLEYFEKLAAQAGSGNVEKLLPLIGKGLNVCVYIAASVLILQALGHNVSAIVAGLGVGGLAFSLAFKETAMDFIGYVVIIMDNLFQKGDWVEFENTEGDVEEIGMRSVKLRAFDKSMVIVPNRIVTNSVIKNWSRMPKRRVSFTFGVSYETPPGSVKSFTDGIRELLRGHPEVDQEFHMVNFRDFAETSLNVRIYYFTASTEWLEYERIREDVNYRIMELAGKLGVKLVKPSCISGALSVAGAPPGEAAPDGEPSAG